MACKFIETSSGLDHNVNELLVGIVAQVKLNPQRIRNLSDKQKMQLAAAAAATGGVGGPGLMMAAAACGGAGANATSASAAAAALVQQKQRKLAAAELQKTTAATTTATAGAADADTLSGGSVTVEAHPLPRTVRENQLFTAGGRPFGQRVVLSIKQAAKQRTTSSTSTASESGELVGVYDADGADAAFTGSNDRKPPSSAVQSTSSGASLASPASRISTRTKYLLTSLMKFKRTLRAKRRNSGSCSDLFVI